MFGRYLGAIRIGDGMCSEYGGWRKIVCHGDDENYTVEFHSNGRNITEIKAKEGNRLLEWIRFGAFHRGITRMDGERISKPLTLHFHPKTRRSPHGLQERSDQMLFGCTGKTRTWYTRGQWIRQEFRYPNHHLAFRFARNDRQVVLKYPDGSLAGIVRCPGGFTRSAIDRDERKPVSLRIGELRFPFPHIGLRGRDGAGDFNLARDGNSQIRLLDRKGRVWLQGEYQNRQRVGEWILNRHHVYYVRGVPVQKKLWDTPPAKLKLPAILRISNAQLRAALIARAGYDRLAKEVKHKVIHEDKGRGNRLLEFPIAVDDGNGGRSSHMRILQVTCTSTKTKYFLNVPDFVWDGGRRTRLDTCEAARQWTFGNDDPRKRIQFARET